MSLITTATKKDMNEVNTERSCQELGLQLRFAAEKGRLLEVRKLLSAGAPIIRDIVSIIILIIGYLHYYTS